VLCGVQSCRLDVAQKALSIAATKQVKAERDASQSARLEEQTRARYIAGVDAAYQRGLTDAQAKGERVAADLRAGTLKLRHLWQGCAARPVSGVAADPSVPDAEDGLRFASAGRITGTVAACQAERDALLGIAEADRAQVKK